MDANINTWVSEVLAKRKAESLLVRVSMAASPGLEHPLRGKINSGTLSLWIFRQDGEAAEDLINRAEHVAQRGLCFEVSDGRDRAAVCEETPSIGHLDNPERIGIVNAWLLGIAFRFAPLHAGALRPDVAATTANLEMLLWARLAMKEAKSDSALYRCSFGARPSTRHPLFSETECGVLNVWAFGKSGAAAGQRAFDFARQLPYQLAAAPFEARKYSGDPLFDPIPAWVRSGVLTAWQYAIGLCFQVGEVVPAQLGAPDCTVAPQPQDQSSPRAWLQQVCCSSTATSRQ
jgi:hypothetical protein